MAKITVLVPKGATVTMSGKDILIKDTREETTWYESDTPTPSQMLLYLINVASIRSVLDLPNSTPSVPSSMSSLTVQEANAIEQILFDVYRQLAIMATTFIPCGEALSGGDNL